MIIIGCDYHPGFQQIAWLETATGELQERRLGHKEEAERFYRELKTQGRTVRVGMEASGHARWFERLLTELQFELWIGDAAAVRSKRVRRQKTDRQDAQLLLQLLLENRFPRIWVPDAENRDLRQLLWHRHRLVQMRTRVMNQLHVVALNEGLRRKKAALAAGGASAAGGAGAGALGQPTTPRSARLTRPTNAEDPPVDAPVRRDGGAARGGSPTADASWSRATDGVGLRTGHRNSRTFRMRQTDRQLRGTGSGGRVQRRPATAGTHQQTG
jgi:transposase